MERSIFRSRLRRLHRLLFDSRYALEYACLMAEPKRLRDLFYMLTSRRVVMIGLIDSELGSGRLKHKPSPEVAAKYTALFAGAAGSEAGVDRMIAMIEEEERLVIHELDELIYQPSLTDRARTVVMQLLGEAEQSLGELGFLRSNLNASWN